MLHRPYGPRGAESEDPEFWTDLTRNSDFLPEPGIVNPVLRSAQEPYTPADAHQDRQTIDDENLASLLCISFLCQRWSKWRRSRLQKENKF